MAPQPLCFILTNTIVNIIFGVDLFLWFYDHTKSIINHAKTFICVLF
jgi:hypothetical protein